MNRSEAYTFRRKIETVASSSDDTVALENVELFPRWVPGLSVSAGVRYAYNGMLYQVIQTHTTQADWTPDITPALFHLISIEEWPEWVQPTGAHDAYNWGDKVTFQGKHYISNIDGNVWSPASYPSAWEEQ